MDLSSTEQMQILNLLVDSDWLCFNLNSGGDMSVSVVKEGASSNCGYRGCNTV